MAVTEHSILNWKYLRKWNTQQEQIQQDQLDHFICVFNYLHQRNEWTEWFDCGQAQTFFGVDPLDGAVQEHQKKHRGKLFVYFCFFQWIQKKKHLSEQDKEKIKNFEERVKEKHGFSPKEDSKLIQLWCLYPRSAAKKGWDCEEKVVERLRQVKYLHEYCPAFRRELKVLSKQRRKDLQEVHKDWKNEQTHRQFHNKWDSVDLVQLAESRVSIVYPSKWPWEILKSYQYQSEKETNNLSVFL